MSSRITLNSSTNPKHDKRTLQLLREEAGFASAKDFAKALGLPETTYSRYERQPNSINTGVPIKSAWLIADFLNCSIDLVVGREDITDRYNRSNIQRFYDNLSEGGRERFDEYMRFLESREEATTSGSRW